MEPGYKPYVDIDKGALELEVLGEMRAIFDDTNLSTWALDSYMAFVNDPAVIPAAEFMTPKNFLEPALHEKFELLYRHRNRCAHNTLSYQENLPTLNTLLKVKPKDDNYFVRFSLLVLIDKIYVKLYEKYRQLVEES